MITQTLGALVKSTGQGQDRIFSKRKAICALFPRAIFLEQHRKSDMVIAILRAAKASVSTQFVWHLTAPYLRALLSGQGSTCPDWVIVLLSPHIPWHEKLHGSGVVARWNTAISNVPYSEEVCENVVDTLLQMASNDTLRPQIGREAWAWLKGRPTLPPMCKKRGVRATGAVVRHIRGLGDIEILKSYFLLVLSEWDRLHDSGYREMQKSIRVDFAGIGMWAHRRDLIERWREIMGELRRRHDGRLEYIRCSILGIGLQEGEKTMTILTREPLKSILSNQPLILLDPSRIPLNLHLRPAPSMIFHSQRTASIP